MVMFHFPEIPVINKYLFLSKVIQFKFLQQKYYLFQKWLKFIVYTLYFEKYRKATVLILYKIIIQVYIFK